VVDDDDDSFGSTVAVETDSVTDEKVDVPDGPCAAVLLLALCSILRASESRDRGESCVTRASIVDVINHVTLSEGKAVNSYKIQRVY